MVVPDPAKQRIVPIERRLEADRVATARPPERVARLRLVSQVSPDHRLPLIWIVAAPHTSLVAIVDHRTADVRELKGRDKAKPLHLRRAWSAHVICLV